MTNWNQIVKNVLDVKLGQKVGMSFTNMNRTYKIAGDIISINGNTIGIKNETPIRNTGEIGRVFKYSFRKSTKLNNVFINPDIDAINEFNKQEQQDYETAMKIIDEYWTRRFEKADKERKEKGVYEESTVYEIDFGKGKLVPQYKKYGISV